MLLKVWLYELISENRLRAYCTDLEIINKILMLAHQKIPIFQGQKASRYKVSCLIEVILINNVID
ncbi:hypothetical protein A0O34_16655 [Chryseobacterium glaciei]|uniref:Uncharacterized protein n=1 Tax=Chryseobacterium glaciei TaxID=1685010 RepID=A0A172XYL2_9FLAO|nr:hypothetical protein A0O34_16655 [Chryseobacterium glaciei]